MGSSESKESEIVIVPMQQGATNDGYHNISLHKSTLGATVLIVLVMLLCMSCMWFWCKNLVNKPGVKAVRKEIDQLAKYP